MQMSRSPASSARSASTMPCRSPNVWPKTSRPQPRSRTTSEPIPCSWCSDGFVQDRLVIAGADGTAVRRRRPATRGCIVTSGAVILEVGLQPELEQAQLPELVALQRGELAVGVGQELPHVLGAEQGALAGGVARQGVAHQVEHLALEVR